MQIIYRATTSTTVAYGAALTTGGVQPLPPWAPPIAYMSTTTPWNVLISTATTGDVTAASIGRFQIQHVRTYGRRPTLYSGAECFSIRNRVECQAGKRPLMIVTYRAVGELVRP